MVLNRRESVLIVWVMAILFALCSCKPSVPNEYIQPDEMEDILYDYHLADGLAAANQDNRWGSKPLKKLVYREAVFKKHGISQAEFDESMAYYFRHTERLHAIYERLSKRLNDESVGLGGKEWGGGYGSLKAVGDTADIWRGSRSKILLPSPPDNCMSFEVKADTSFHVGDRFIFNFDALFIYQEGIKEAVAVLSVRFANDSIASQIMYVTSNSHYSLQIEDRQRLGIREVRGVVMIPNRLNESSRTYKLLSLYNIHLVRMHVKETAVIPTEQADTVVPKEVQPTGVHISDRPLEMDMSNEKPSVRHRQFSSPEVVR